MRTLSLHLTAAAGREDYLCFKFISGVSFISLTFLFSLSCVFAAGMVGYLELSLTFSIKSLFQKILSFGIPQG